jgi:hypothetical protein
MTLFESKMLELMRRGEKQKVEWMKNLDKTLLPSQIKRIQQNDKTVLMELVVPKWVDWKLLYDWGQNKKEKRPEGEICILCNNASQNGIRYLEKFLCESCFLKLKNMQ